jgi:ABC-type transport system substrate-binding protein
VTATLDTVPVSARYDNAAQNAALIQLGAFTNRSTIIHIETFVTPAVPVGISGGYAPPAFNALVAKSQTTVDPAARQDLINQLSMMLYNEGPYVVWGYANNLDAAVSGVRGVVQSQSLPLFGKASLG